MFPNNHEIMYRSAQMRNKEIHDDVAAFRGDPFDAHNLRRRYTMVVGIGLIGLTLLATTLMLVWWVL